MLAGDLYGTMEVLGGRRLHERNHSMVRHKHLIDRGFLESMNSYLNQVLQDGGREPVIAVFDSPAAVRYYRFTGSAGNLLRLACLVPARYPRWRTFQFAYEAMKSSVSIALGRRDRGLGRI